MKAEDAAVRIIPPVTSLRGSVALPGSKSITNRALIMSLLSEGTSTLINASDSEDTSVLLQGLERLGLKCRRSHEGLDVDGAGGALEPFRGVIDVGPAGTTMRFLTALSCFVPDGEITLRGSERMHQRPIGPLVQALRTLGADISYAGQSGCPPLLIRGKSSYKGGRVAMEGGVSSQFFTALLLISPLFDEGLELEVLGEQVSRSYIDVTIACMRDFGVEVENLDYRLYRVAPGQRYRSGRYAVEGDASGASYFWAAAALGGGRVRVLHISPASPQGDARFPELLREMGCCVRAGSENGVSWIEVEGGSKLQPISADMSLMPDTAQTLAVVAAAADGISRLSGLGTLRVKETDRIAALCRELAKLGTPAREGPADSIEICGGAPLGARIQTYDDHRMAMAFAVMGARVQGIVIEDPRVVGKSLPQFWEMLRGLGVGIE